MVLGANRQGWHRDKVADEARSPSYSLIYFRTNKYTRNERPTPRLQELDQDLIPILMLSLTPLSCTTPENH
jgi:hypothetical protein